MRKVFLLTILFIVAFSAFLTAQHGQDAGEPVVPQTTKFYFGQNIEGDVLMVKSTAIFDSRAPLGSIYGMIHGITGEVTIWLDSIMVVETKEAAEEPVVEEPVAVTESGEDAAAEETAMAMETEPAEASGEAVDTIQLHGPKIEPPAGYTRPIAAFNIPVANLMTGIPEIDQMLKSEEYINIGTHPVATFTLTGIQDPSEFKLEDNREISLVASGELSMNGLTKRYSNIRVFLNYITEKPITKKNTVMTGDLLHFSAEFTISLSDFAIAIQPENLLKIDDKVNITVDAFGSTVQASANAAR